MSDSKIIMSEELQGLVPDLEDDVTIDYGTNSVVHCEISNQEKPLYGPLIRFSFQKKLNVELKSTMSKTFEIYRNKDQITFDRIKIIYCNEFLSFDGPFKIKKIEISDVKQQDQICTLRLSLSFIVKE